jgi:Tol biopolymer transport system component/PKD repeat protein
MTYFKSGARLPLFILLVFVAAAGIHCDGKKPSAHQEYGAIDIALRVPGSTEAAAKAVVARGRIQITGEGMATRDTVINVSNNLLSARFDGISLGSRTVSIDLMDGSGSSLWQASTTVTVAVEATATATLALERINDTGPDADFTASATIGTPQSEFEFNAQVSDVHDSEGDLQVRWDFDNDGEFETNWSAVKSARHTFGEAGNFSVTLQVRDPGQLVGSRTQNFRVVELVAQAGRNDGVDSVEVRASGDLVTLDGSRSSGIDEEPLVYDWLQLLDIPEANQVSVVGTLSDNNTISASRVSFEPRAGPGLYVFTLRVRDEATGLQSGTDTVYVNVLSQLPVAQVADPANVRLGESVALQGTASDDSGEPTVRWRGEGLDALSDTTVSTPVFTPAAAQVYEFFFVAIDAEGQESEAVRVQIAVSQSDNNAPEADAGDDVLVHLGDGAIGLDGSDSIDPDGDGLSYNWTQIDGPETVDLSQDETATPSFVATTIGVYRFALEVNDGRLSSASSEVLVSILQGSGTVVDVEGAFSSYVGLEHVPVDQVGPGASIFVLVYAGGMEEVSFYDIILQVEPATAFVSWEFFPTAADRFSVGDLRVLAPDFGLEDNEIGVRAFSTPDDAFDGDAILGVFQLVTAADFSADKGATIRLVEMFLGTDVNNGDEFSANDLNIVGLVNEGFVAVENQVPVADAGRDAEAINGQRVVFDGSGSFDPDGDGISQYDWYQVSGPVDLELDAASGAVASFVPTQVGAYVFGLVVRDAEGAVSEEDLVRVVVSDEPVKVNQAPVAVVAQPPASVVGDQVRLNGTGSFDPDGDTDLEYDWFVISGPVTVELNDAKAAEPVFVAEAAGVYVFSLLVSDGELTSEAFQVEVEVDEATTGEEAPVAVVTQPPGGQVGQLIKLDGSGSSAPDGRTLFYLWDKVSGPAVQSARGLASATPRFTPLAPGKYVFELRVAYDPLAKLDNDGGGIFDIDIGIDVLDDLVGNLIDSLSDEVRQRLVFSLPVKVEVEISEAFDGLSRVLGGDRITQVFLPQTNVNGVGPAGEVPVALIAQGLDQVEIFDIILSLRPIQAFDLEAITFDSGLEGFSVASVELVEFDAEAYVAVRVVQNTGSGGFSGDAALGVFTLVMNEDFDESSPGQIIVQGLQIGSFADFDAETAEIYTDADVAFAMKINGGFGGTVDPPSGNNPPIANAGEDREVEVGERISFNGDTPSSDPDGDVIASCEWSSAVTLEHATSCRPIFVATEVGEFVLELVVTDDRGARSLPDQVVITVTPPSGNNPPIANAGEDREVEVGERISFNGDTPSSDPDGDVIASCEWTGSSAVTLEHATSCRPIFVATEVGEFVLELVVTDGRGARSLPDQVVITVTPSTNRPPVAVAGPDQTVQLGDKVRFNGRESFDPDEGDQFSFRWVSPDEVELSFPNSSIPSFDATQEGVFGFVLIVTDQDGAESDPDQLLVTVVEKLAPQLVADAGRDREVEVGETVVLNGSNSTQNGLNDGLEYQWYQEDGPFELVINGDETAFPTIVPGLPGDYFFTLEVSNSDGDVSDLDTVVISAVGSAEELVVDAGQDQQVEVGQSVTLSGSSRGGVGDLYYYWFQEDGPVSIAIPDAEEATIQVTLPKPGEYIFVFDVEDDIEAMATDTVVVLAVEAEADFRLVFASNVDGDWDIYSSELDGSFALNLTANFADDIDPDVSDDGRIVFTSFRDAHIDAEGQGLGEIYTMNGDGSNPVNRSASHLVGGFVVADEQPVWSPDGQAIAFASIDFDAFGNLFTQIFTMPATGGVPINRSQAPTFDSEPSWDPLGGRIAFSGIRELSELGLPLPPKIYVMNANGNNQIPITSGPGSDLQANWGTNGRIAFVSDREGDLEIFVTTAEGAFPVNITNSNSNEWRPSWSPDGAYLAFISDRDGGQDLYILEVATLEVRRVTQGFGLVEWPAWTRRAQ